MEYSRRKSLWSQSNFLKLWTARTISLFGSAITTLALPLTAISILHATPFQMGLLLALGQVPQLLFGFVVGAWVDRVRRRPLLLIADLGRTVLLALIPLLSFLHFLGIEALYVLNFFIGVLSVIFTIASTSFLPSLVEREDLVEANTALQVSQSAAQIAGPSLAGIFIQLVTAPMAIIGDSISFFLSALFIWRMGGKEGGDVSLASRQNLWEQIRVGLDAVVKNPILRALAMANGVANIFWGAQLSLLLVYMTEVLKINSLWIGIIYACGNAGFLIGTLLAKRVLQWWGLGWSLCAVPLLSISGALLVPVAHGSFLEVALALAFAQFLTVCPLIIYHIHEVSLRQSITPDALQGRVNATTQVVSWATTPLGALLGGWLGEWIGIRSTLFLIVGGLLLAQLWLWFSPVRTLRTLPQEEE
ncbi:MFS transporter [Ktedonobacter racemifer]|uniref:Major facilitator superfamily MFS_1 n=1 Tax=Ktedonobacter racemifer DSM 44963 TaxID=485913 RepID=D6TZQ1_KTERA|nr:MFS transporter [Ktedonobacter racemifer]EFH82041.1 major facilitator superfamily MFS_1 [Ktedonobacter racemifer DSM 44963]